MDTANAQPLYIPIQSTFELCIVCLSSGVRLYRVHTSILGRFIDRRGSYLCLLESSKQLIDATSDSLSTISDSRGGPRNWSLDFSRVDDECEFPMRIEQFVTLCSILTRNCIQKSFDKSFAVHLLYKRRALWIIWWHIKWYKLSMRVRAFGRMLFILPEEAKSGEWVELSIHDGTSRNR